MAREIITRHDVPHASIELAKLDGSQYEVAVWNDTDTQPHREPFKCRNDALAFWYDQVHKVKRRLKEGRRRPQCTEAV